MTVVYDVAAGRAQYRATLLQNAGGYLDVQKPVTSLASPAKLLRVAALLPPPGAAALAPSRQGRHSPTARASAVTEDWERNWEAHLCCGQTMRQ